MAAKKPDAAGGAAPALPPLTVARFEQAMILLERIVDENTDLFVGRMHAYRERARQGSSRALTATEAAQVAAGLAQALGNEDVVGLAEDVQAGELRAVDEPSPLEVLLAAGVATAPAALQAGLRMLALLELPADEFEEAYEADALDAAIEKSMSDLRALDLDEARARAVSAMEHLASKAGAEPGEGVRLLARAVWQALNQAAADMAPVVTSGVSSLIGSPPPTDGTSEPSSTEPVGAAL